MLKPKGLIQGLNWYLEMARGTGLMVMDQAKTCHGKVSKCREMGVGMRRESWRAVLERCMGGTQLVILPTILDN